MKDYVYKMLKKALKNDFIANEVLTKFNAYLILDNNRDFYWYYEQNKCNWICKLVVAKKNYSHKLILASYKKQIKDTHCFWYEEHNDKAKEILKADK